MKKLVFTLLHKTMIREITIMILLFCSLLANGKDRINHKFLLDGKEWRERADHIVLTYSYDETGNPKGLDVNTHSEYYSFSIMGDTLINGKNFKKFYLCAEDTLYYCAMYEEGSQVTYIPKDKTNETMLYDFGHPVGEYVEWDEYWPRLYLLYEDAIEVGGQSFRRMNFTDEGEFLEDSVIVVRWVEGIGSSGGLFRNDEQSWLLPNGTEEKEYICTYFESCYEDGKCIFTSKDFTKAAVTDISPVVWATVPDETVYDLQGRRVQTPQPGGLYIRSGRKFIFR